GRSTRRHARDAQSDSTRSRSLGRLRESRSVAVASEPARRRGGKLQEGYQLKSNRDQRPACAGFLLPTTFTILRSGAGFSKGYASGPDKSRSGVIVGEAVHVPGEKI